MIRLWQDLHNGQFLSIATGCFTVMRSGSTWWSGASVPALL